MELLKFKKFKEDFENADVDKKIDMYVTAENLTSEQYKELLRSFPYSQIARLEKALG